MMAALQTKPYALQRGEGQSLQLEGTQVFVMASSEQTGGAFNLFEVSCLPGYATALQIHYAEDVAVYVLEGALTFFWGDEKKTAVAGSYLFQPRGTPHGFRVEGVTPARILYLTCPAGLDWFVIEQGLLTPKLESATAAARYKIEILGLLPE
ncbi:Quercetin 2,3-dioxygenase [Thermoflexales bacterium]|nr:Quercetin 2,3-dioxygenase [Thermoflexales bacterium]